MLPSFASATTYYVRADGTVTAANKANATSQNSASTSLNMAQVKLATFSAGDQVLFSSQGGNYTEVLNLPSGGSGVGSEITYANVSGEIPIIAVASDPVITTNTKSNVKIIGFSIIYSGTGSFAKGIYVTGDGSSNITINQNTINMGGYGYGIISGANNVSGVFMDGNIISNVRPGNASLYFYGTGYSNFSLTNHAVTENSLFGSYLKNISGLAIDGFEATGGVSGGTALKIESCSGVVTANDLMLSITAGVALSFVNCSFGQGSAVSSTTIQNATENPITVSGSTGTVTMSGINITGTGGAANTSMYFTGSALTNSTISATISNTAKIGFYFSGSSGVTVSNSSYSGTGSSGYLVSNNSQNISFTSDTSDGLTSGGGFYEVDSSNISYTDCTATNGKGFVATTSSGSSSNISYLRCHSGSQSGHNTGSGFLASNAVSGVTYTRCNADYNTNLGFVAINSANNITYWYNEASYNGTVNVTGDGGAFLPHNTATNVKVYYSIAHHNYNEGFGDVSGGTNVVYNSVNWANGYGLGDTFWGSAVTTPTTGRGNMYFSMTGGSGTFKNIISGNGKPRERSDWVTSATTFDYNLYDPLDNGAFITSNGGTSETSWEDYHNSNEINSQNGDPKFINASSFDFSIQSTSPAIDAGTAIYGVDGNITDYAGNSIYGIPDIGAYEYQPPYTVGTHEIPTTGSIRIYSDGKYRMKTATTTATTASFSVTPVSGNYLATTTQYMDLTIDTWSLSGDQNKQWTATSTEGSFLTHATSTIYTVGDLVPNTYYTFYLDSTASTTAITGTNCTNGTCLSDSNGQIIFTYGGGYSTHTFALTKDTSDPASFNLSTSDNTKTSGANPTLTWEASSDTGAGISKYQLYIDGTLDTDNISSTATSVVPNSLTCGNHTWYIRAVDSNGNTTDSSTRTITKVCDTGSIFTGYTPNTPTPVLQTIAPDGTITYLETTVTTTETTTQTTTPETTTSTGVIYTFIKTLSRGSENTEVTELQKLLRTLNFFNYSTDTGYYGTITETAVKEFQCHYDIVCSGNPTTTGYGLIGPKTREKLNSLQTTTTETTETAKLEQQISELLKIVEELRKQLQ